MCARGRSELLLVVCFIVHSHFLLTHMHYRHWYNHWTYDLYDTSYIIHHITIWCNMISCILWLFVSGILFISLYNCDLSSSSPTFVSILDQTHAIELILATTACSLLALRKCTPAVEVKSGFFTDVPVSIIPCSLIRKRWLQHAWLLCGPTDYYLGSNWTSS